MDKVVVFLPKEVFERCQVGIATEYGDEAGKRMQFRERIFFRPLPFIPVGLTMVEETQMIVDYVDDGG